MHLSSEKCSNFIVSQIYRLERRGGSRGTANVCVGE